MRKVRQNKYKKHMLVPICILIFGRLRWVFTSSFVSNTVDVRFLLLLFLYFCVRWLGFYLVHSKNFPECRLYFSFCGKCKRANIGWRSILLLLVSFACSFFLFPALDKCRQRTWVRAQNVIRYLLWKPLQKKCWFLSLSKFRQKRNKVKWRKNIDNKFESRWRQKNDHSNARKKELVYYIKVREKEKNQRDWLKLYAHSSNCK